MPGGDIFTENLEQRIERIRKRDEEIEKKHREAEADRLAALQANAMVKTKAPDDEDWPKAHKYDKLDFTYDVKEEIIDEIEKKTPDEPRLQRPFKKFPEGQGPPADPTYNFLADAERDGKVSAVDKSEKTADKPEKFDLKKDWRANNNNNTSNTNNNNNNNNNSNKKETGNHLNRRSNNNNSFNRGKSGAKAKVPNGKGKQNSNDDTFNTQADRNSDEKMKRTKSIEGNWRQESIDEKKNEAKEATKTDDRQKKFSKTDGKSGSFETSNPKVANKQSIQQRLGSKQKTDVNNLPEKLSDLSIEKRGNITVSVTKDGEVKSVKFEETRAIGTGRVGNGATMRPNVQPVVNKPVQSVQPQQQSYQPSFVANPSKIDSNLNALAPSYTIDYTAAYQQQQQQQQQPQAIIAPAPPKPTSNIVNGVPFKLPSIQERLTKNRIFFDENLKNTIQNGNGNANN